MDKKNIWIFGIPFEWMEDKYRAIEYKCSCFYKTTITENTFSSLLKDKLIDILLKKSIIIWYPSLFMSPGGPIPHNMAKTALVRQP